MVKGFYLWPGCHTFQLRIFRGSRWRHSVTRRGSHRHQWPHKTLMPQSIPMARQHGTGQQKQEPSTTHSQKYKQTVSLAFFFSSLEWLLWLDFCPFFEWRNVLWFLKLSFKIYFLGKKKLLQFQTPAWGSFSVQSKLENLDCFMHKSHILRCSVWCSHLVTVPGGSSGNSTRGLEVCACLSGCHSSWETLFLRGLGEPPTHTKDEGGDGIDMCTLLYMKQITNKEPYSALCNDLYGERI